MVGWWRKGKGPKVQEWLNRELHVAIASQLFLASLGTFFVSADQSITTMQKVIFNKHFQIN